MTSLFQSREKRLYQERVRLYQEIAGDIAGRLEDNPEACIRTIDPITLRGGCQDAARLVRDELKTYGVDGRILRVRYCKEGPDKVNVGTHFIVCPSDSDYAGSFALDPTYRQFDPKEARCVFPFSPDRKIDEHPLQIMSVEDITDWFDPPRHLERKSSIPQGILYRIRFGINRPEDFYKN